MLVLNPVPLAALRDALLPKLVSGELRVNDQEVPLRPRRSTRYRSERIKS